MTVSSQVKQAVAGLKSAEASFETFALQTQDQNAKQLYIERASLFIENRLTSYIV